MSYDIVTIVGTRPQFIKSLLVSIELRNHDIKEFMVHTNQHFSDSMSWDIMRELCIHSPNMVLESSTGMLDGKRLAYFIQRITDILDTVKPRACVIYGDCDTTLAGAIAAHRYRVPLIHVEGGIRTYNRAMVEETNRLLTDCLSHTIFTPTERHTHDAQWLTSYGVNVVFTGDVMYDMYRRFQNQALQESEILHSTGMDGERYTLVTLHRQENVDNPETLKQLIGELSGEENVIFPVHPRS